MHGALINHPRISLCSIKGQNTLLKKAVLDERDKVKGMESTADERERELRRLKAEVDKLNMLATSSKARIEKLKRELEDDSKQGTQSGSAWDVLLSSSAANPQQVLTQRLKTMKKELTTKTEECEALHLQVADIKSAHRFTSETLEQRIQEMKALLAVRDETIAKLERDKVRFDKRLQSELVDRDAFLDSLQKKLETLTMERTAREGRLISHNRELGQSLNTVERKLLLLSPFDPLRHPELAALNLPPHARPHRVAQQALCADVSGWLSHLCAHLQSLAKPLAIKVFLPHLLPLQTHSAHLQQQQQGGHHLVAVPEARRMKLQMLLNESSTLEALEREALNVADDAAAAPSSGGSAGAAGGNTTPAASPEHLRAYCRRFGLVITALSTLTTYLPIFSFCFSFVSTVCKKQM
jgi:hypothetical protein